MKSKLAGKSELRTNGDMATSRGEPPGGNEHNSAACASWRSELADADGTTTCANN